MGEQGRKSSRRQELLIEVGPVRIKTRGFDISDDMVMELLGTMAGVALAAGVAEPSESCEDSGDERPFGFAPITAITELADDLVDTRFDYVWEEEEE